MNRIVWRTFLGFLVALVLGAGLTVAALFGSVRESLVAKADRLVAYPTTQITAEVAAAPHDAEVRARLSEAFGFPITVVSVRDVELDAAQWQRVRDRGRVVVLRGRALWAYTALPERDVLLAFGPLPELRPEGDGRGVVGLLIVLLVLSFAVGILVWPLVRQLRLLSSATRELADGDLGARAPVVSVDETGGLANSFNEMAARIAHRVQGQQELLHGVSHELRTPLARIRYGLELLRGDSDTTTRAARIEVLDGDVEALDALVGELLSYGRLQDGRLPLEVAPVEVGPLLDIAARAGRRLGAEVAVVVEPVESTVSVRGDARLLARALDNLVRNAVRHARGEVRLAARTEVDGILLRVEDDGPGVPDADRSRIFEPFVHGSPGGNGLGLALVHRIVAEHRGEVWVEDAAGGGACFVVRLPAAASRPDQ